MQRILSVAQQLRGVDLVSQEAVERRLAGDVATALDMLEQAKDSGDPFVEFARRQQIGEIRAARGDRIGAQEVFDSLKEQAPQDPEIRGWARPRPKTESAAAQPTAGTDDAEAIAAHLFHKDNYTFDTMEIFEDEYENRSVSWSGELKRLRRFDYDRDFGDGPAVKAVFRIAVLGTDLYSGRDVDAIVRLPTATAEDLEVGHRYTFRGTLNRCDPAMRNLFIAGATLT